MSLPPSIQLLTASLDLQLVRLIRGAINPDRVGGAVPGVHPRRRIEPEPEIEPRRRIEPEPRFEPRLTIHPEPAEVPNEPLLVADEPIKAGESTFGPLPAPWQAALQERPWDRPVPPSPAPVKIYGRTVDIENTGRMLDQFA